MRNGRGRPGVRRPGLACGWLSRAVAFREVATNGAQPNTLIDRTDLDDFSMTQLMRAILTGELGESEMAAALVALRMKGESANELATAARVMRAVGFPIPPDAAG